MVADAPYRSGDLIVSLRFGAVAGALASVVMVGMLAAISPLPGISVRDVLVHLGGLVAPKAAAAWVGMALMAGVGAVCGVLYATSQQRIPARGLIAVGVFYGVIVWVVGGLLVRWSLGGVISAAVHSWPWLVADVAYGLGLAGAAMWAARHSPAPVVEVQLD